MEKRLLIYTGVAALAFGVVMLFMGSVEKATLLFALAAADFAFAGANLDG